MFIHLATIGFNVDALLHPWDYLSFKEAPSPLPGGERWG
jgi:hypothetical protein